MRILVVPIYPLVKNKMTSMFMLVMSGTTKPYKLTLEDANELARQFTRLANQFIGEEEP